MSRGKAVDWLTKGDSLGCGDGSVKYLLCKARGLSSDPPAPTQRSGIGVPGWGREERKRIGER